MNNKLAIVTEGGGMKGSYSAGVLCALAEIYNLRDPDILVGSSGSTGSLAYYVAGQYDFLKIIWTNLLVNPKFLSLKRFYKIMDIDYLIDVIFKKEAKLDVYKITQSNSRLFISATENKTGKLKYFTNNDNILEALRASSALPVFYNKKVNIDNVEYIDGAISSPLKVNIDKAISEGAKKLIIIRDSQDVLGNAKIPWYIYYFLIKRNLKKLVRQYYLSNIKNIESQKEINTIIISPSCKLLISTLDNKKEHLEDSFNLGYKDVENSNELKVFLDMTKLAQSR